VLEIEDVGGDLVEIQSHVGRSQKQPVNAKNFSDVV
jgi:hypothetical protein